MFIQKIVHNNIKSNKGLTFIELSISMILLSVIALSATLFYTSLYKSSKIKDTEKILDKVEEALNIYVLKNGHLPCPADQTIDVQNSSFGEEKTREAGGECNNSYVSNGIYYGVVPTKILGLSNKYALDAWDNKISYFVRGDFAKNLTTFTTTPYNETSNVDIEIKTNGYNAATSSVTEYNAIYVLASHGYNGRGAYKNDGGQIKFSVLSGESGTSDESYESEYANIYIPSFNRTKVQDLYDQNFDDIVRFKTKYGLIYDAGWEGVGCLGDEIDDTEYSINGTDFTWSGNSVTEVGDSLPSNILCSVPTGNYVSLNPNTPNTPEKVCGPYGEWSNTVYECVHGCDFNVGGTNYYIADGDSMSFNCPVGQIGQVVYSCSATESSENVVEDDSGCITL